MSGFDVLGRETLPFQRCFLEASAGTGKTFAIENLIVRLLMEENGPLIDEILVVTFTKAATVELKARILQKLKEIVLLLQKKEGKYDYIQKVLESGHEDVHKALKRVKRALASFEEAKIFTIHSFCFHSLQEYPIESDFPFTQQEEEVGTDVHVALVKDFLRTFPLHPKQWEILLKAHKGSFENVVTSIVHLIEKRAPIEAGRSFKAISDEFALVVQKIDDPELLEALQLKAGCYSGMRNAQKKLKKEVVEGLSAFCQRYKQNSYFPFDTPLVEMKKENLLKTAKSVHFPSWDTFEEKLIPLVEEATDENKILSYLAEQARIFVEQKCREKEIYFFEDQLLTMQERVKDEKFAKLIREKYKAVFIDEFQDTDKVQWEIFQRLFSREVFSGPLYLIGDPKQSIYRFRHADLYTFMGARGRFSDSERKGLMVNFRAHKALVEGLNCLLAEIPDFLYLPKTNLGEKVPKVSASSQRQMPLWQDGRAGIHFILGQCEEELFGFIASEIKRLQLHHQVLPHKMAVLVKDRFQAEAFARFAKQQGIKTVFKKTRLLTESGASKLLEELLQAVLDPNDKSAVVKVLAGPLFQWNEKEVLERYDEAVSLFFTYRIALEQEGILQVLFRLDLSKLQSLFGGHGLYSDLIQLGEILSLSATSFESYLPELKKLQNRGDKKVEAKDPSSQEGVQILTIHVSKGLEFDVVFPIGLIKATTEKKKIVLDPDKGVLTDSLEALSAHHKELEAEKMRLLYVALTRAKERLYMPVLKKEKKTASPMDIFLEKLLMGTSLEQFILKHPEITLSNCSDEPIIKEVIETKENMDVNPEIPELTSSPSYLLSFSALAHHQKTEDIGDTALPAGKEFGLFLHSLLETINLHEPEPLLKKMIEQSSYFKWVNEISNLVSNALHLPLLHFTLQDVDPLKMWKEVEFLYPDGKGNFLKGFIDLLFEHEGKVYFLDWKSNAGTDVEAIMEKGDYFLQAKIYREAVERYLHLFSKSAEYGGCFFLFVRQGMVYHV